MANESFPMLVGDRLDYTEGAYDVAVTRASQGAGMLVRHRLSGRNLVVELLKRSEAAFAVEVSAPYATYREIRPSEASGEVEALQRVSWNPQDVVPPVYLRPMVIATVEQLANIVLNGEHGVHEVWQGVEVEVTPGAILAAATLARASLIARAASQPKLWSLEWGFPNRSPRNGIIAFRTWGSIGVVA